MRNWMIAVAATVALGGLAGCETATPYQPLKPGLTQEGGYSETRIEQDRWRVTFHGNGSTPRETVETYLLYRAAELTVNQGDDWFEAVQRQTDKDTETLIDPGLYGYGYGWRPYWRYYGPRGGWSGGPFWGGPVDVQRINRYEASAEIIMHHGAKPADDKHAFDAHQVLENLAGKIVKPAH